MLFRSGTAYILVHDEMLNDYPNGGDSFVNWLLSDGFKIHDVYHGVWSYVTAVYVNINNKTIAFGMPGIRCFDYLGKHAVTIEEFKQIYAIFKKYEGKEPFVFG